MTLRYWRAMLPPNVARRIRGVRGCWIWTGAVNAPWHSRGWGGGYGYVGIGRTLYGVHRLVYYLLTVQLVTIPDPKQVAFVPWLLHGKCRNRRCCNPRHLHEGDNQQNQLERFHASER